MDYKNMLIERTSEKVDIIIEKVAITIIAYCFNLSVMFKTTFLFIETKGFCCKLSLATL
jgi:hypothetical protein